MLRRLRIADSLLSNSVPRSPRRLRREGEKAVRTEEGRSGLDMAQGRHDSLFLEKLALHPTKRREQTLHICGSRSQRRLLSNPYFRARESPLVQNHEMQFWLTLATCHPWSKCSLGVSSKVPPMAAI